MNVEVKLFAVAKQLAGQETIVVEVAQTATVADLRASIAQQFTELAGIVARTMIAIDTEYVGDEIIIAENAEIALIPPVSGG